MNSTDDVPITFREPSYALFDIDANAVLATEHGNLAVFSTRGMAELWASKSAKRIEIVTISIRRFPVLAREGGG